MNNSIEDKFTVTGVNKDGKFFKKGFKFEFSFKNWCLIRNLWDLNDSRYKFWDLSNGALERLFCSYNL